MTYYISRLEMHFTALSLTFTFLYYHYEHPQTLQKIQMKTRKTMDNSSVSSHKF